ncbi:MAG: V-type ATP synthase subunit E [Clostridia bacterium]|nr:V-type ATP synthase subunit E [Clostridia bacterium]
MTGLEKILEKINTDSGLLCSEIEARAAKECEKIAAASPEKGKAIAAEAEKKAKADGETVIRMAKSAASQISRQTILAAKVEAVNETLDKLLDTLRDLPAEKYFPAIIKLAAGNAMSGKCIASLGKRDLERMPSDFGAKLGSALAAKGAECTLSDKPENIASGVFLDYGNIAIDCSFESVIEEKADIYKEKISEIIF